MEIYLVRHTTPKIEKGICYGQSDLELTEDYLAEFEKVKSEIPHYNSCKVISSPLQRCMLLAKAFDLPVVQEDRLKELDFGNWEMMPWNDIPKEVIDPWMQDFVNEQVPNGESYVALAKRVSSFFEEIVRDKATDKYIIVTHAGPMRALLSNLLEIPLEKSFSIKIEYGAIFRLKKEGASVKVLSEVAVS